MTKSDFKPFGAIIRSNLDTMLSDTTEIYRMDVDPYELWDKYLEAFPEGTNPMFRERTQHDCSCCKHFIRNMGQLVVIKDGRIHTIWDGLEAFTDLYPYNLVAGSMASFIRASRIKNIYRTRDGKYGAEETTDGINKSIRWNHFHGEVPRKFVNGDAGPLLSRMESNHQVFSRGLKELKPSAIQEVLGLIKEKLLYRGEEHLESLKAFQTLQRKFTKLNSNEARDVFIWENIKARGATLRNSVIGTLVTDLSDGKDLEASVASFEKKVAPENYKRPTALITPKMIEGAVAKLRDLGLESAVKRRYAKISDVTVNNVLFVDNEAASQMKDGLTDLLMEEAVKPTRKKGAAEPVTIEDFMQNVLPHTTALELVLKNSQLSNFVSLTAPQESNTGNLFKWSNDFAWSYDGELADSSISDRVKAKGGRVEGAKLRFSLAWFNFDDLDIHVTPPRGRQIFYGNKQGILDVDMNAGGKSSREAVENCSWMSKPVDGKYTICINQYTKRENIDLGFTLELESAGKIKQYHYKKAVTGMLPALAVTVKDGVISHVKELCELSSEETPQEKWGVKTLEPVRVSTMMYSPNYWDNNKIGNKHYLFMLENCINPEETRGIYNEFLTSALEPHRKVFEILGSKTKCATSDEQLSGVGFSSTRGDTVIVLANGKPYEITF